MISERTELSEPEFVDAIQRRLRFGRFVVLIISDGIREGVEELTDYLQLHAGLHTGLALVDLSIWRHPDASLLVVPRIPARTVLIERGIVRVSNEGAARIDPVETDLGGPAERAYSLSEAEFWEQLEQSVPEAINGFREFLTRVEAVGVEIEYKRSLILRFYPKEDDKASAGYIEAGGRVIATDGWWAAQNRGNAEAGERYLRELAEAVGGRTRPSDNPDRGPFVEGPSGKGIHLRDLIGHFEKWASLVEALVSGLSERTANTSDGFTNG